MRIEEVLTLGAGEEMDLLVYDLLMGRPARNDSEASRADEEVRGYSKDIRQAERVLLRIVTGGAWTYARSDPGLPPLRAAFRDREGREVSACGETRALAICRAALLTVLTSQEAE